MFERCALDSDVVLKIGRYRIGDMLMAATSLEGSAPLFIAAARFACRQRARRWAASDPDVGKSIDGILARVLN